MRQVGGPGAGGHPGLVLGLAVVCAIVAHFVTRRWLLASLGAGLAFTVLIQVLSFASLGYLDPFAIVALPVGALAGFAIAVLAALPFVFLQRRRREK